MSPLGFLLGMLTPSPLGPIARVVRRQPSRYARAMPTQVAFAGTAGFQRELSSFGGGSEDWGAGQLAAGARSEGPALGAVTLAAPGGGSRVPWPVGMFVPHLPGDLIEGRGTGYHTGAYPKGWIRESQAGPPSWGGSAGIAARRPIILRSTLLEPSDVTPKARAMADTYATEHAGHARLTDLFGD